MPELNVCRSPRATIPASCLDFGQVGIGVYVKVGMMYFAEDFVTD